MVGGFVEGDGELLTRSEIEGGIADQVRRTGPSGSFGWSRQDFDVINSSSSTNTQGTAMNTSWIGFIINHLFIHWIFPVQLLKMESRPPYSRPPCAANAPPPVRFSARRSSSPGPIDPSHGVLLF